MSDVSQVHADLVRAAGFESEAQETDGPPGFDHLVVRAGRPTVARHHGHLLPMLGMTSNRRIDGALQGWEPSTHQCHIASLQLSALQLGGQTPMAVVVLCYQ
jgi:hypothetical protein